MVYDVGFLVVSTLVIILLFVPYYYYLKKQDAKDQIWHEKFAKMVEETDPVIKDKLRKELGIDYSKKEEK